MKSYQIETQWFHDQPDLFFLFDENVADRLYSIYAGYIECFSRKTSMILEKSHEVGMST